VRRLVCSKEKRVRAYVLLKSDTISNWSDSKINEAYGMSCSAIERLRKRFVEEGFEKALNRKDRLHPPRHRHSEQISIRTYALLYKMI